MRLFNQSAILDDNNEFKQFLATAVAVLGQFSWKKKHKKPLLLSSGIIQ